MTRPTDYTDPARRTWRATRQIARHLDRVRPRWYQNDEIVAELYFTTSPRVLRCWKQHIRQRRGF